MHNYGDIDCSCNGVLFTIALCVVYH